MQKIFCFGNEFVSGDETAKLLAKKIKHPKCECILIDNPLEILAPSNLPHQTSPIYILDVVKGLAKVTLLEDINNLELHPSLSCHDLDLGFYLKLMQETGTINAVKIIGLPYGERDLQKLQKEVESLLEKI